MSLQASKGLSETHSIPALTRIFLRVKMFIKVAVKAVYSNQLACCLTNRPIATICFLI